MMPLPPRKLQILFHASTTSELNGSSHVPLRKILHVLSRLRLRLKRNKHASSRLPYHSSITSNLGKRQAACAAINRSRCTFQGGSLIGGLTKSWRSGRDFSMLRHVDGDGALQRSRTRPQ